VVHRLDEGAPLCELRCAALFVRITRTVPSASCTICPGLIAVQSGDVIQHHREKTHLKKGDKHRRMTPRDLPQCARLSGTPERCTTRDVLELAVPRTGATGSCGRALRRCVSTSRVSDGAERRVVTIAPLWYQPTTLFRDLWLCGGGGGHVGVTSLASKGSAQVQPAIYSEQRRIYHPAHQFLSLR